MADDEKSRQKSAPQPEPKFAFARLYEVAESLGYERHVLAGTAVHKEWDDSTELTHSELAAGVRSFLSRRVKRED